MDSATLFYTIVSVVGGILIAIIGYFLKRTVSLVDRLEQDMKCKAGQAEFEKFEKETKARLDKLAEDIVGIKEDYITKDDFFRVQGETDRKLNMIIDILLKREGKNG